MHFMKLTETRPATATAKVRPSPNEKAIVIQLPFTPRLSTTPPMPKAHSTKVPRNSANGSRKRYLTPLQPRTSSVSKGSAGGPVGSGPWLLELTAPYPLELLGFVERCPRSDMNPPFYFVFKKIFG
jgi:hypothetical protein